MVNSTDSTNTNPNLAILVPKKFIIAGLVRDCAKTLEKTISRIDSVLGKANTFYILIESDSKDATVRILGNLAANNPNIIYESFGLLELKIPNRLERLTFCRNRYLQILKKNFLEDFNFVIVADFDGVNSRFSKKSFASCWEGHNWSVCTANQWGPYYDISALRKENWVEEDCFFTYRTMLNHGRSHACAFYLAIVKKMFFRRSGDWIEVDSAFGGFAIYRKETLLDVQYGFLDHYGNNQCEHVGLHASICNNGNKIFINTRLINAGLTRNSLRAVIKLICLLIFGRSYFPIFGKKIFPE